MKFFTFLGCLVCLSASARTQRANVLLDTTVSYRFYVSVGDKLDLRFYNPAATKKVGGMCLKSARWAKYVLPDPSTDVWGTLNIERGLWDITENVAMEGIDTRITITIRRAQLLANGVTTIVVLIRQGTFHYWRIQVPGGWRERSGSITYAKDPKPVQYRRGTIYRRFPFYFRRPDPTCRKLRQKMSHP